MIDNDTAIEELTISDNDDNDTKTYYDLLGRQTFDPHGIVIERSSDGRSRKVMMKH